MGRAALLWAATGSPSACTPTHCLQTCALHCLHTQHPATPHLVCLQGEGDSSFVGSNRFFPFSTVVFASWDFHLTDPSAARNLRRSIRNQLKEMVNDALLADKIISRKTKIKEFARKVRTCGVLRVKDTHGLGW